MNLRGTGEVFKGKQSLSTVVKEELCRLHEKYQSFWKRYRNAQPPEDVRNDCLNQLSYVHNVKGSGGAQRELWKCVLWYDKCCKLTGSSLEADDKLIQCANCYYNLVARRAYFEEEIWPNLSDCVGKNCRKWVDWFAQQGQVWELKELVQECRFKCMMVFTTNFDLSDKKSSLGYLTQVSINYLTDLRRALAGRDDAVPSSQLKPEATKEDLTGGVLRRAIVELRGDTLQALHDDVCKMAKERIVAALPQIILDIKTKLYGRLDSQLAQLEEQKCALHRRGQELRKVPSPSRQLRDERRNGKALSKPKRKISATLYDINAMTAFHLRAICGYLNREVAIILGVSEATATRLYQRGCALVRDEIIRRLPGAYLDLEDWLAD